VRWTRARDEGRAVTADRRRRRLLLMLAAATGLLVAAGLAAGGDGFAPGALWQLLQGPDGTLIVGRIRLPRTLGAWLAGALLGLAGAIAQGLFRNPLADPFLLGSASGASLAVVGALAAGSGFGGLPVGMLGELGLAGAAFAGALGGVGSTLVLARGAQHSLRLLLAGVVVGVVCAGLADLITLAAPEALRGRQVFMLGSTGFVGWGGCALLAAALVLTLPPARLLARGLDALLLGDDSAASLGLRLPVLRLALVALLAAATAFAVAQCGLVAFVGLAAPHLVRWQAPGPHAHGLLASAAAGGVLLLAADLGARVLIAPQELPVGVLTAVGGGAYLLALLRRQGPE
jgi:iron complex transport system permease protein